MARRINVGLRFIAPTFLMLVSPSPAEGQVLPAWTECAKVLVPDVTRMETNVDIRVSFLSEITETTYAEHAKNSALSGYFRRVGLVFGGDATYNSFDASRKSYFRKVGVSESYRDTSGYLINKVPDAARALFVACMQNTVNAGNDGPSIFPVFVEDNQIVVKVSWKSPPGVSRGEVSFVTDGITEESRQTLPRMLDSNAAQDFLLRRVPGTAAFITVTIGARSASWRVPLRPAISPPVPPARPQVIAINRYETEGNRMVRVEMCPADYEVIPNSGACYSTSPNQSGPAQGRYVGNTTYMCQWDRWVPIGVGLGITLGCKLTP